MCQIHNDHGAVTGPKRYKSTLIANVSKKSDILINQI